MILTELHRLLMAVAQQRLSSIGKSLAVHSCIASRALQLAECVTGRMAWKPDGFEVCMASYLWLWTKRLKYHKGRQAGNKQLWDTTYNDVHFFNAAEKLLK